MIVRCVTVGVWATGQSGFYICKVVCDKDDLDKDRQLELAMVVAKGVGMNDPIVQFDDVNDLEPEGLAPEGLFSMFNWDFADILHCAVLR